MADLTNKLKNRARREEQRENWSAAIELYSRALRASERNGAVDVSLYNRIGDIYLRLDDIDSAIGYYERAIVRYAEQDLYTSAIALCNKLLRVQPSRISAYLQLGRLQLETGLGAEARVNYLRYATELLTRDQSDEAYAALEEYVVRTEDLNSALRFAGALVANDRGEEALSLLVRLKSRLEGLDWDTAPLERPIAAIQGFGARPPAVEPQPVPAGEEPRAAPAGTPETASSDLESIVDLEAELEAAVGEERREKAPPAGVGPAPGRGTEEPDRAALEEEGPAAPEEERPAAPEEERPAALEESELLPEPLELSTEAAGDVERSVVEEAPDGVVEPEPIAASSFAEPEAPEVSEEDERRPRVPPEKAEDVDVGAGAWTEDARSEPEPVEARADASEAEIRSEAGEPEDPSESRLPMAPAAPETPAAEPQEADEAWSADIDPGGSWPTTDAPERAPGSERATSRPARSDGDAAEPSLPASRDPRRRRTGREALDETESEALAPAARLGVGLAEEEAEGRVEATPPEAWVKADEDGSLEGSESIAVGTEDDAAEARSLPEPDESEEVAKASPDARSEARERSAGVELPEANSGSASPPSGSSTPASSVATEPPETTEVELPEAGSAIDPEIARRHLEAGRDRMERGELDRAIEELELAIGCPACFVEAHALRQECRLERDAAAAEPAQIGPEPADAAEPGPEPEAEPAVEPESEAEPKAELAVEPEAARVVEREPEPVGAFDAAIEPEPEPEGELEPAAETESELEPPAAAPEEMESLPEIAIGPTERTRSSWLLSTARATAEVGTEPPAPTEAEETVLPGGRPPDEPFRTWLAAASYEVLKRALEALERREELQRALCVVERMLELEPREPSLHRLRIAHAAELGRDELLPRAYMELAALLEETGDLLGARGAYERVLELDPERPQLDERLRAVGDRIEEAGLQVAEAPPDDMEDDWEAEQVGFEEAEAGTSTPSGDMARESLGDARTAGPRGPLVQVYRGVVQDLGTAQPATPESHPAGDRSNMLEGEGTVDFDVILAELKDQLAEKAVDEPDGRSRAEVGERLMEMGLLDDAIRELQAAVRGPDAPPRAFELLGRAFIEKGQARVASRLLEEALEKLSGRVAEERLLGVLYQLGVARQESEDPGKALECYERIFSVDIDYRDVRERIEACAAA